MKDFWKRKRNKRIAASALAVVMAGFLVWGLFPWQAAAAEADPVTAGELNSRKDTRDVGRVWTDKSVSSGDIALDAKATGKDAMTIEKDANSDFLVGLSAMSSAAQITGQITTPLDIVLVMDVSGSMEEEISNNAYLRVYANQVHQYRSYYVYVDDAYKEVSWSRKDGWHYSGANNQPVKVTPKTSAADSDEQRVQFYSHPSKVSKMTALKNAVDGFLTSTEEFNKSITDSSKKTNISMVKFAGEKRDKIGNDKNSKGYNYTQIVSDFSNDMNALKNNVNSLSPGGMTQAGYAMEKASELLHGKSARKDAQKIVVFFTDGQPTTWDGFEGEVANAAIAKANELETNANTLVYTVGVFNGADPSDTKSDFNRYMNALSSNYPEATTYTNLGQRVSADKQYYKAATNAEELNTIFENIIQDVTHMTASHPTEVDMGAGADNSGYITFEDPLGQYMEVTSMDSVVFGGVRYKQQTSTTEGNKTTVTFTETSGGNALYPRANLDDIRITITKSEDLATGDVVKVEIPAAMIPIKMYRVNIDKDGKATTTLTDTAPIRVFYNVKLKNEVREALGNPDEALQNYIANNTKDGKVQFYSNLWHSKNDVKVADATSNFVPAKNNDFYYFQRDTKLYTNKECTTQVSGDIDQNATYYYQRTYYEEGNTKALTRIVEIPGNSNLLLRGYSKLDNDGCRYVPKGTPRATSLNGYKEEKSSNTTETASYVIDPDWEAYMGDPKQQNSGDVLNRLGNNGRISEDVPGALQVSKTVTAAEEHTAPSGDQADDFTFTVKLDATAGKTLQDSYEAQIFDAEGNANQDTLTKSDQDTLTFTLKGGQNIKIYGLDAGVGYKVTESDKTHYTEKQKTGDSGTIESGKTAEASFTNEYQATSVELADGAFKVKKNYNAWESVPDSFQFLLKGFNNAPMPEDSDESENTKVITVNKDVEDYTKGFGEITYDKPGTYYYELAEVQGSTAGISYSAAKYVVEVKVEDKKGTLNATTRLKRTIDDSGEEEEKGEWISPTTAEFTNTFEAESQMAGPNVFKRYTDHTGSKQLANNMFQFTITKLDHNAPFPDNITEDSYIVNNTDINVAFKKIPFTVNDIGKTYSYSVQENMPPGATEDNQYTVNGMTYDPNVYIVKLAVTAQPKESGQGSIIVVTQTWCDSEGKELSSEKIKDIVGNDFYEEYGDSAIAFRNSYRATSAVLEGETALGGTKTLNGRDMKDGETFSFALSGADPKTKEAIDDKAIVIAGYDKSTAQAVTTITEAKNGNPKAFAFGTVTFNKIGTYKFSIKEQVPNQDSDGMTWDRHTATVTVTVTDDNGQLEAAVSYKNNAATFTNTYRASMDYSAGGGLEVGKTLNGRGLKEQEFQFRIAASGSSEEEKAAAEAKLHDNDKLFSNDSPKASGVEDVMKKLQQMTFTQDDAGKTYTYIVKEDLPQDEDAEKAGIQKDGVTYDQSEYQIDIRVVDHADGTMETVTTVKQLKNSAGETIADPQENRFESAKKETPSVAFTNTYITGDVEFDFAQIQLKKIFSGRTWKDYDTFQFKMENTKAPSGVTAPMPDPATITVGKPESGNSQTFDFGKLTFTQPGEYQYTVEEVIPKDSDKIPGVAYDYHKAVINIGVIDNGNGQLVAQNSFSGTEFNNTYRTEDLNLADVCGVRVTKVLHGHDMTEGQFVFSVTADNDASASKLSNMTLYSPGADSGAVAKVLETLPITLTQSDIGKTYSYTFAETKGNAAGYKYDENTYNLDITTHDAGDGTLTATVVLTNTKTNKELFRETVSEKDKALGENGVVIPFENRYDGSTDVSGGTKATISADKTLTGRSLKAEEFTFMLAPKLADGSEGKVLQTEKNKDDGTIPFEALSYKTSANAAGDGVILSKAVKDGYATKVTNDKGTVYTLYYRVYENTGSLPAGVTGGTTSFDFTVTVTDNGNGTLTAVTNYPDGKSKFGFVNQYGTDNVDVNVTGSKTLYRAEGLNPNDITGKFNFTLEAMTPGAPMPDNTTAKNDAAGNVDFGKTTFKLSDLEDVTPAADGSRSKAFEYKVTESGSAAGVTNDTNKTKPFQITLKDDGKGKLTATCNPKEGPKFTFTNTYSVGELPSSITDQIKIDKNLTGRDLKEGEFTFELLEDGQVVATGSNDASGNVTFNKITYTEPGQHTYTVREVNNGLGGVTYDDQLYTVQSTITDNRDGTMNAEHEAYALIDGKELAPVDEITFTNKYEAKGTTASIGAVKRLTGKDLKDGQFTFQLKDENGKVIDEAKNDKAGAISFKALEFDKAGTYKYTISEVNDKQKEIKYDTSEKAVTITVKDSGDGYLQAQVESEKQLIFTNTFEAAGGSGTKTGDNMNLVLPIMMMLTAAAIGSVLLIRRKYHR